MDRVCIVVSFVVFAHNVRGYTCLVFNHRLRGILQTSRSVFEECDLSAPHIHQWSQAQKGGVMTFTPELGAVYYFIDSVAGGCQNRRKIRVW